LSVGSFINRFDGSMTNNIQGWPAWVHPIMTTASFLGEPIVVVIVALSGALEAKRRHHDAIALAFTLTIVASGINAILKQFLHRTRPDTLYVTTMKFKSYSFPSGHAFGSIVTYGLVAYLAVKYLTYPWNWLVLVALSVLIATIGLSRIYLGAHFPSDVMGGWILGGLVLLIITKFLLA
jgi:undecaprenyl-diphosphatase